VIRRIVVAVLSAPLFAFAATDPFEGDPHRSRAWQVEAIHATTLCACRWQYIASGVQDARFLEVLGWMIDAEHGARINAALASIVGAVH
jgi:hypothetical protein